MKKTLLLTENFPPKEGGSGRWFWELYSRLPNDKVLIVANDTPEGREFDKTHELDIVRIELESTEWGLASTKGLGFYWETIRKVLKLIKEYGIEEVHCGRVIPEGVIARALKLLAGARYNCFVHGEDVETAATSREHSLLVKNVCKNASMLICNSENTANIVRKLGFDSGSKCEVLHPGVDTSRFEVAAPDTSFRQKMGWSGKRVLLTVGRLQRRKGQDFLIKSMPTLLNEFPDLFYAVVGRGECYDELISLVDQHELHDKVCVYPDMDDEALIKCYQQCDIFILPNRTIGNDIEGFGMVLVEAQVCGKPVIAGDSGGTRETMNIGKTGHIIDCSSTENLLNGLSPILRNPEIVDGEVNIADYAKNRFNWDQHVAKAKRLFK
ncbi:Glycosyltransferase family 4 protein [Alteromonas macleodii]|jgi:phosphatidylinositol alpha-1,6-mannosyltransferase|uniref:glycosyltransferase family 4 protein n=1 Tax=Alteromonas macleodii TaxID=28108 RepID=UPI00066C05CA|nr:glycosyltransferase family 4 protein [Alteromonas macleodii]MEE3025931.1 glycosyltransferase family 4 protein [Pseudomonadota bacterium]NKX31209.1 glycosyltransferase family 4 protein [Alteromonadaceae bacterium A_SAG1]CAI3964227.1 6-mannosyltransferase [Alteromonas macleodii]VTP54275.1 6-mannosyltransferase [Alteromonas macleodii]